jgi:hypothetical protein
MRAISHNDGGRVASLHYQSNLLHFFVRKKASFSTRIMDNQNGCTI